MQTHGVSATWMAWVRRFVPALAALASYRCLMAASCGSRFLPSCRKSIGEGRDEREDALVVPAQALSAFRLAFELGSVVEFLASHSVVWVLAAKKIIVRMEARVPIGSLPRAVERQWLVGERVVSVVGERSKAASF